MSWRTESNLRGYQCYAFTVPEIEGTKWEENTEVRLRKRDIKLESRGKKTEKYLGITPENSKHSYIIW